ncbi:MAG TPA: hypothetical protein VF720_09825 [Candidatus Eisenbacteria bacterium]
MTGATRDTPLADKALRRLFLTLFVRGRTAVARGKASTPKSVGERLFWVLLSYTAFGIVAFAGIGQPVLVLSAMLHGFSFFCLAIFLMTTAGETLFNREEPDILMHRPVEAGNVLRAKVRVMLEVAFWIAGALNLFGLLVGTFAPDSDWRFPFVHLVSTGLSALFTVGIVVLSYELCLRWIGRERLESLLTTVQVGFSILIVLASQFGPRVIGKTGAHTIREMPAWGLALPPVWFAGFDDALAGSGAIRSWAVAGLAVGAALLVLWLALGRLAGAYAAGLQTAVASSPARSSRPPRRWLHALVEHPPLRWWVGGSVPRAAFALTLAYLFRDRETRLRVYPGVVPMIVIPALTLLENMKSTGFGAFSLAFAGMYVGLIPMLALDTLRHSSQAPAAMLFRAAPLPGPAPFCLGARRAVTLLFGFPVLLALAAAIALLDSDPMHLLLLLPGLLLSPILTLFPCINGHAVPLSRPVDEGTQIARTIVLIALFAAAAMVAGVAALCWRREVFGGFLAVEAVIVLLGRWIMGRAIAQARWAPAG